MMARACRFSHYERFTIDGKHKWKYLNRGIVGGDI